MKSILGILVLMSMLVMSVSAYDQMERIKDMQTMEQAMAEIQKGILYNNSKLVVDGVSKA